MEGSVPGCLTDSLGVWCFLRDMPVYKLIFYRETWRPLGYVLPWKWGGVFLDCDQHIHA